MVVWCDQEALVTRVRLYAATNLVSAIQQVTTTDWHCHRPRNSASPVLAHVFSILHSFPPHQQYHAMTSHKPFGRRWLTREQYIRYFLLCASILDPDSDVPESERRQQLAVWWH